MKEYTTNRGFYGFEHEKYPPNDSSERIIQESSAIGNYDDALDNPGSSYLWVGDDFHLSREEVQELIGHMQYWLENKRLPNNETTT